MPSRCIVAGCSNTTKGVSLHKFPKKEIVRRIWTAAPALQRRCYVQHRWLAEPAAAKLHDLAMASAAPGRFGFRLEAVGLKSAPQWLAFDHLLRRIRVRNQNL